jgi:hypothetical protein
MNLYGISEEDVRNVLKNGETQKTRDGKLASIGDPQKESKYPIKIISLFKNETHVSISAYPFKRRRKI